MQPAELARLRHGCYRFFSALFRYPDEEQLANLVALARELLEEEELAAAFAFFGSWQRLVAAVNGLEDPVGEEVEENYIRLFVGNSGGLLCHSCESFYLDPRNQALGSIAAQVESEYIAAGVTLSPSLNELPDHASVELEFMALLCEQEARAWKNESEEEELLQVLERQAAFLRVHLVRWFPIFADRVAVADRGGLYSMAAAAARAFIQHDHDLIAFLLQTLRDRGDTWCAPG